MARAIPNARYTSNNDGLRLVCRVRKSDHGKQEALDQLGKAGGSDCRIYKCN
jgi:hypothetical protein